MTDPRWVARLVLMAALPVAPGCFPGSGHVQVSGDGALPGASEGGTVSPAKDTGSAPRTEGVSGGVDAAVASKPDLTPQPTGPQPPFGNTVGLTATNFDGIPDCDGQLYSLYSYYNTKKGVLIAMMSPS
jgi:hypothetical protein